MNYDLRFKNKLSFSDSLIINHKSLPETDAYFQQLAGRIKETGVKLVFVGLGAPKQEYFISNLKSQISNLKNKKPTTHNPQPTTPCILMSVGGALDIFAGNLKRAPKIIQRLHLEWLWRLILEPRRFKRQLKLFTFVTMVLKKK